MSLNLNIMGIKGDCYVYVGMRNVAAEALVICFLTRVLGKNGASKLVSLKLTLVHAVFQSERPSWHGSSSSGHSPSTKSRSLNPKP